MLLIFFLISKPHDLVLGYSESHKWLGCMLSASPGLDSAVEYHLQQAAKAFQKHRWMLQCKDCSIKHRLRYFEAVVSSTACLLQSTDHYTENIWRNLTFSFENLFVALWGLHRAQLGQHNGMISYMSGICAWITGPTPVEFFLVKEMHDSILELRFLHCNFTCRTLGEEDTCMATTSNISSAWMPATHLGHEIGNVLQVQGCGQLGDCCEKCGPMGLSFPAFPGFLLYVIISSTFSEGCL